MRRITRRDFTLTAAAAARATAAATKRIPEKTVVLTFDDAVKSHRTVAGPLLQQLGFRATFFVTHRWMEDREHFMSWDDIAALHKMGFEIGNHSWTHPNFSQPRNAARLAGEMALVENELRKVGVPRPVSFAYSGNGFGPEAVLVLREAGIRFARRGGQPEVEYGSLGIGARFNPSLHHRLVIPTTGDGYPNWDLDHFKKVVAQAPEGEAVILQFHGVPDVAHPWVHTPEERFRGYMQYLKNGGYRVIALRDLDPFIDTDPDDPMLQARHPAAQKLALPNEQQATRDDLLYWLAVMRRHGYSLDEIKQVAGTVAAPMVEAAKGSVLPYPGGRHTRIGFLEGAIDPLRGTKASIFLPWDPSAYVVVDLPEAIFSGSRLLFLAHTHVPTVWNERNVTIGNVDWRREPDGALTSFWKLPEGMEFGSRIAAARNGAEMELWLRNGTKEPLTNLRAQICVLLRGAPEFAAQSAANRDYSQSEAAVHSSKGSRRLMTSWEPAGRVWGNPPCPCIHSDPRFPDCRPGETVRATGRLAFA